MTNEEIISRLKREPLFALRFAVGNNPEGVISALVANGYTNVVDKKTALDTLKILLETDKEKCAAIISDVHYLSNAPDGSGGLQDFFMRTTPPNKMPNTPNGRLDFSGLMAGLGTGLLSYVTVSQANAAAAAATPAKPLTEAEKAAEKKRLEEEAAKEKTKRNWLIGGIIGGTVILIIIVVVVIKSSKPKQIN